jgi:hypothetical protein
VGRQIRGIVNFALSRFRVTHAPISLCFSRWDVDTCFMSAVLNSLLSIVSLILIRMLTYAKLNDANLVQ